MSSLFLSRLNKTLDVIGLTQTGEDGGGQPIFTEASKGTVRGRIDPKVRPDEMDNPDANPVISRYRAITALPSFTVTTDDVIEDGDDRYEIVGTATLDGRSASHHLELDLRRIT
jgi:hypothetical protein